MLTPTLGGALVISWESKKFTEAMISHGSRKTDWSHLTVTHRPQPLKNNTHGRQLDKLQAILTEYKFSRQIEPFPSFPKRH